MAKTSSIQRNLKRIKLTKKFLKKREDLKKIIKNKNLQKCQEIHQKQELEIDVK